MTAITNELLSTIQALQRLPSLQEARLGGGTSIALRFDHRESVDVDLLFSEIIGKGGFMKIEEEVRAQFKDSILMLEYPCDINDQFVFLRFLVRVNDTQIKVEIIQNMIFTETADVLNEIKILSLHDIGMLKLMAVANRANYKDVYDLCYLTDFIPLATLLHLLAEKQSKYADHKHRNIFDLDNEISPVKEPERLLNFDKEANLTPNRPRHSSNKFKIANGINWQSAKTKWKRRVNEFLHQRNAL